MLQQKNLWVLLAMVNIIGLAGFNYLCHAEGKPHRIVLDTDVDTDDLLALLYLLKLNRSEFELEVTGLACSLVHRVDGQQMTSFDLFCVCSRQSP